LETKPASIDALKKRIDHLRKAYAKGLGHRPSTLQAAAIDRAARLSARAEAAACNPDISANDLVRLDGCASRARDAMEALLKATKPNRALGPDSLKAYAREKYSVPA
jgi:hypothetical protein